ncbi:TonB-dependent receptor [Mucilaginibacter gynuensis]|uniref:TonB-dependent receptor n=2 Tax=Mucilaginibacter gynuensis TaxID=1302236 RepID=A0ABP8FZB7_9SPHI
MLRPSHAALAQKVTLNYQKVQFSTVIKDIEQQTGYVFLYTDEMLTDAKTVDVNLKNSTLDQALKAVFENQRLTYTLNGQTVVIQRKPATIDNNVPQTIRGKVIDNKGQPIPGVTVKVKGTAIVAITDTHGNYAITFDVENALLQFSFVGYAGQEVPAAGQQVINIILLEEVRSLSDVVVIGYGTQKREDINGAVASIKAADLANTPQPSIDQLLQGKVSGVTITQNSGAPGSNTSVHIRGITSLQGNNEPLYVIDGVPISGDATNYSTSGRSPLQSANVSSGTEETAVSPLSLINPNDIASVDILKDASATAIYGSRASNGVIIITTKRGKSGSAKITYDGYAGFQQPARYLEMMNLKQYATLHNAIAPQFGVKPNPQFADQSLLGEGTNWQKAIFRSASMQSHQLSVSGGADAANYYISGSYLDQTGMVIGSDFKRYTIHTNLNGKVGNWFDIGTSINASRTNENTVLSDNTGIIYNALLNTPDLPVRNADGSFAGPFSYQTGAVINPVAQALSITNNLIRNKINGNIYSDIRFSKDLVLRSEINGDFNFTNNVFFNPSYTWGELYSNLTATLSELSTNNSYWGWKEYLTYTHIFKSKHNLTALLGHELSEFNYNGMSAYVQGFYSNDIHTLNLGDAATARNGEFKGSGSLESLFARSIYTYNGKYSLTATIRADKSSNFADSHNVGYFPSVAASWRVSDEPFMNGVQQQISGLKLRLGYGQVGNQDIPGYLFGTSLVTTPTGLGTGFFYNNFSNPNLTWQTSIQTDVGVDFSLFKNRISIVFDWYNKTSKNFLFQQPLPGYISGDQNYLGGINPPYINAGKLSNKGFEFSINSKNIQSNNVKWESTIIFSHYTNKVISLANNSGPIIGSAINGFLNLPVSRTVVGGPIGEFYGYKSLGAFKTDEQLRNAPIQFGQPVINQTSGTWLGDLQYEDLNHDGVINEKDQAAIGNPNPKFTYGITNNISYKSIELSVFLNGSYGAKILNLLNRTIGGLSALYQNQLASQSNFWTPQNPGSNIPAPKGGTSNANLVISDRFIESGSYLRIQTLNLGYRLPAKWISKVKLSQFKVFVSAQNLYTFTSYKGYDPEIGSMNQNVFLTNIDNGRNPIPRTFTAGINATF